MAALLFFIALALGGAAMLFRYAHAEVRYGTSWAVDVCSASNLFCGHSDYLAYAAGGILVLAVGAGLGRALTRD
ncbi:hypothetical protein [Rhodopseudomonas palustris]|uniref:Uncharacterized protein n=1 Tax=Rhodopseudomonas palustris (strain BisB18) TaxID=316056 RepID=Q211K6_RHOPB